MAVVSFQPGSLDIAKLSAALYEKDRIAGAPRIGPDRGGLRFSPHFYNLHTEVERALAADPALHEDGGLTSTTRVQKMTTRPIVSCSRP